MPTNCPKCNAELYCPCPSCRKCEPKGLTIKNHYYWERGEIICCPACGYKDHCDTWLTAEEERWRIKDRDKNGRKV